MKAPTLRVLFIKWVFSFESI